MSYERRLSATQLPIETIVALVGQRFDPANDTIFGGNGGAKINKFLDSIKNIVIYTSLIVDKIYFI